jgi:hypothetical protein
MRGFTVCFVLALAFALSAWVFMDSWFSVVCVGGALWMVLLAVRHGMTIMGGKTFHQDEATDSYFIKWFRAHLANQRAKENSDHVS